MKKDFQDLGKDLENQINIYHSKKGLMNQLT